MNWDEGDYFRYTQLLADDIARLDLSEFWSHTNKQRVHPFLYSWIMAPSLLMGATSVPALLITNHLLLCVFPLMILLLLVYVVPNIHPAEAVCFSIMFSSAPVTMEYVSVLMPEFIGLPLLFSGLVLWSASLSDPSRHRAWLSGLILPAVFFLKFSLGIILITAIIYGVAERLFRQEPLPKKNIAPLFSPFLLASLLWFLTPVSAKFRGFFGFVINRSTSGNLEIYNNIVTYLAVLKEMVGVSPIMLSWILGAVLLAFLSAKTHRMVRFHLVAGFVALMGLAFHQYTVKRLAIHLVPSAWILSVLGYIWLKQRCKQKRSRMVLVGILTLFMLLNFYGNIIHAGRDLPKAVAYNSPPARMTNWWINPRFERVLEHVSQLICAHEGKTWIVGEFNELNPGSLELQLVGQCSNPAASIVHDLEYPGVSTRVSREPVAQDSARKVLASVLSSHSLDNIILITVHPDSPLNNDDYWRWHSWKLEVQNQIRHLPEFQRSSIRRFNHTGVTVELYRFQSQKIQGPKRIKRKRIPKQLFHHSGISAKI